MCQRAAHRPVHLGHATQAVCVLHARVVSEMRLTNLAVLHEQQKVLGRGFLARVRTRVLQTGIECDGCAFERFETHRPGHICHACEALRARKRQPSDRMHRLGAVQQRQAFLYFQLHRFQLCAS